MKRIDKILLILFATALVMMLMSGCAQQGNQGASGLNGLQGSPGTTIAAIQFCPSQGPTTHNHFPEQGICINEKIIAAFWDGTNAFLAEIVPGSYTSTSTGLQCTFTIINGCNIQ